GRLVDGHVARKTDHPDERSYSLDDRNVEIGRPIWFGGVPRYEHVFGRLDLHARKAPRSIEALDGRDPGGNRRSHEWFTRLQPDQRQELRLGDGQISRERHVANEVTRTAVYVERDDELVLLLLARVQRRRVTVPTRVEIVVDCPTRVLQQIFVRRALRPNRDEPFAFGLGQRVANESHDDARAAGQIHRNDGAILDDFASVTGARLVEPAGVHLVFPRAQFALDHVVLERLADLDVRQLGHRALNVGIPLL